MLGGEFSPALNSFNEKCLFLIQSGSRPDHSTRSDAPVHERAQASTGKIRSKGIARVKIHI